MPKNPFADKAYDTAFKEYQSRNSERVERQKARELKKEGKAKLEKRKKEKAVRAKMKKLGSKKKRGRVEVLGVIDNGVKKRVKRSSNLDIQKD